MAQSSTTSSPIPPVAGVANPVVGPQYCSPDPVDLAVVREIMTRTEGNFIVTDLIGKQIFGVTGVYLTMHDRHILHDADGNPILTLRQKLVSAHDRWQAFRGDSTESKDLIFTAKRSSFFQLKTKLAVFLASNTKMSVPDFSVQGSWGERTCVIHAGESPTNVIARMRREHTLESVLIGKDKFNVTVSPHADQAFVVALIVILDAINSEDAPAQ